MGEKIKVLSRKEFINILVVFNVINICVVMIFYSVIPNILNYPPGSVNTVFQKSVEGMIYREQFFFVASIGILLEAILLAWQLLTINGKDPDKIRERLFNIPARIYFVQVFIPVIFVVLVLLIVRSELELILKISILISTIFTSLGIVSYIYTKTVFKKLLVKLSYMLEENGKVLHRLNQSKIGLRGIIFLQLMPMIIVAIAFTALIGYSRLAKEKGEIVFEMYKKELDFIFPEDYYVENTDEVFDRLSGIDRLSQYDFSFIITPDDETLKEREGTITRFFYQYLDYFFDEYSGRTYEYYGTDERGAVIKRNGVNGDYYIGIKYRIVSTEALYYYIISFIILLLINSCILLFFSKSIVEDIKGVARNLRNIIRSNSKERRKLPITSNDEIGDLEKAFNDFEEHEAQSKEILVQQERMASLGQFIGGIAHNMKSPIFSIAGAMEAIKDLIKEYDQSIGNADVTEGDFHDIATEMMVWSNKVDKYLEYMNDVITTIKEQSSAMSRTGETTFTVSNLASRIKIITSDTLKKHQCNFIEEIEVPDDTRLSGDPVILVQAITNMINNAIDAYAGNPGKIEFIVKKQKGERGEEVLLCLKDYAGGIPGDVRDKLFKQMYTTKGKKGTGLGLYISYSTVRSKFGGDIKIEVEEGKSTTFIISIPVKTNKEGE